MLELLLWLITAFSCFFGLIFGMVVFHHPEPVYRALFVGFWAIAISSLSWQWRRDAYNCCLFSVVLGFLVVFFCGAALAYTNERQSLLWAGAIVGAAVLAGSIGYIAWTQHGPGSSRSYLCRLFPRSAIFETEDVHFVITQVPSAISAGCTDFISLQLQNCCNVEKRVCLPLVQVSGAKMDFVERTELVIPPVGIAEVAIPIRARSRDLGSYQILLDVLVGGKGGRRVLTFRGRGYTPKVSGAQKAVFLAAGSIGNALIRGGIPCKGRVEWNSDPVENCDTPLASVIQVIGT